MKLILLVVFLVIQERATLNTPVSQGNLTDYQVTDVSITIPRTIGTASGTWSLHITYCDNKDKVYTDFHEGIFNASTNPNGADVLVKALNKADLTVKSLNRRALEHLISEGKIPASVINGTPQ